jgi:hypothetical protein
LSTHSWCRPGWGYWRAAGRACDSRSLGADDRLLEEYTDAEVAEQLNQQGYHTFDGMLFQSMHVPQLRRHHHIPDRYARLRARGMLTAEEMASLSGVSAQVIWRRYHQDALQGYATMIEARVSLLHLCRLNNHQPR